MTEETTAVAAEESVAEEVRPLVAEPVSTPVPAKKSLNGGKAKIFSIAAIAVLSTLLLIIVGLFAMGRIMFVPAGAQFRRGLGGGAQFNRENMPEGFPSEEEIRRMEEEGMVFEYGPAGGGMRGGGSGGGPSGGPGGGNGSGSETE